MAEKDVKLDFVLGAVDKFSGPFKRFNDVVGAAAGEIRKFKAVAKGVGDAAGITRLTASFQGMGSALGGVRSAAGGFVNTLSSGAGKLSLLLGAAGGGFLGLSKSVAESAENMGIFAAKAGVGVEAFQKLAYGAGFSNIQTEEFGAMLGKLGNTITSVATGNKDMAAAFKAAGVSVKTSGGQLKTADQVMVELADTFASMRDGPEKTALAIKLFGEEGVKLIPFLSQGSAGIRALGADAEKLGIVFKADAAAAGGDFNKTLGDVKYALQGLGNTIGQEVLPIAQDLLGRLKDWITANRELIGQNVKAWVQGFAERLPELIQAGRKVLDGLGRAVDWLGSLSDALGGADRMLGVVAAVLAVPLVAALGSATGAFLSFGLAIMTTPVGWILGAAALIAGAAYEIYKHWDDLPGFFKGLWDGVKNNIAVRAFLALFAPVVDLAGSIYEAWSVLSQAIPKLWESITGGLKSFVDKVSGLVPAWLRDWFSSGDDQKTLVVETRGQAALPSGPPAGAALAAQAAGNTTTTQRSRADVFFHGQGLDVSSGPAVPGVNYYSQNKLGQWRSAE